VNRPPNAASARSQPSIAQLAVGACVLAVLIQSFGPIIVRKMSLGGLSTGFNRCWLGTLFTAALLFAKGGRLNLAVMRYSLFGGVVFGLNIATFFQAARETSVANATVIAGLQPLALLLVVNRLFGEKPARSVWIYTAVAIGGVALALQTAAGQRATSLKGDLLAFIAMLLFAAYFVASKYARRNLTTLEYQTGVLIYSTIILFPIALLSGQRIAVTQGRDWIFLGLMVIGPGTGHLLVNYSVHHVPLFIPGVLNLWVPIGSTLAAWWLLDQHVNAWQMIGIAICVAALAGMVWNNSARQTTGG